MRFGRRRLSPGSGRNDLMTGRILRELHYDEGALALRRLENLLPGNVIKTCSCYRCLFRARRTYRLERHELRLGRDCLCLAIDQTWLVRKKLQFDPSCHWLTQLASTDTNRCTWTCGGLYSPRLNRQRPKLSLDLQVLVHPVPVLSSTTITAHASSSYRPPF